MDEILRSLGMETVLGRFQAQCMEPETTMAASDQELVRLGMSTIGDRIRLRDACKRKIEEPSTASTSSASSARQVSAARQERLAIFNPRRHNSRPQTRAAAISTTSGASRRAPKRYPWTPTFFCLADTTATKTPSAAEKQILFKAGLGLTKLDLEDDEQMVTDKIMSEMQDTHRKRIGISTVKNLRGV